MKSGGGERFADATQIVRFRIGDLSLLHALLICSTALQLAFQHRCVDSLTHRSIERGVPS